MGMSSFYTEKFAKNTENRKNCNCKSSALFRERIIKERFRFAIPSFLFNYTFDLITYHFSASKYDRIAFCFSGCEQKIWKIQSDFNVTLQPDNFYSYWCIKIVQSKHFIKLFGIYWLCKLCKFWWKSGNVYVCTLL